MKMRTGKSLARALIDCELTKQERRVVVEQLATSAYGGGQGGPLHPIVRNLPPEHRRRIADALATGWSVLELRRLPLRRAQDAICDPREALHSTPPVEVAR
jgi:hypothetical protein